MSKSERTIIGVPFYDGEGVDVLGVCLRNLDDCLNNLNVDARIVVGINGPRVSLGEEPISQKLDRSRFNTDVSFIKSLPGIVQAERAIIKYARDNNYTRIFLTDADISRLPLSLSYLWNKGDRSVVGANYCTYPKPILEKAGIKLSDEEFALIDIFEADKHPLAIKHTGGHRPKRLKGSLILLDVNRSQNIFGGQNITTDSVMNSNVPEVDRQLVREAAFLHYPRVDLTDHIQARLRHYRAAASEGRLDFFSKKSLVYTPVVAESIAMEIRNSNPNSPEIASNFLLQCALRLCVDKICKQVIDGKKNKQPSAHRDISRMAENLEDAQAIISSLMANVDFESLDSPVTSGKGVTQSEKRTPIDLAPLLLDIGYKKLIQSYLGLEHLDEI